MPSNVCLRIDFRPFQRGLPAQTSDPLREIIFENRPGKTGQEPSELSRRLSSPMFSRSKPVKRIPSKILCFQNVRLRFSVEISSKILWYIIRCAHA